MTTTDILCVVGGGSSKITCPFSKMPLIAVYMDRLPVGGWVPPLDPESDIFQWLGVFAVC
jgi:hypothetical protein